MTKDKKGPNRNLLVWMLKCAGAIAILCTLFTIVDTEKLLEHLYQLNQHWFLLALSLTALSPLLTALRLKCFLNASGISAHYGRCILAMLAGSSMNLVLPARGGDFAKMAFLKSENGSTWGSLGSVALLERGFDVLSLGLIGIIGSLTLGLQSMPAASISTLAFLCALGGLVLLNKSPSLPLLGKKLQTLGDTANHAYANLPALSKATIITTLCWLLNSSIIGCLLKATTSGDASLLQAFAATPPAILAGILPITLWGMGTRDGALVLFLAAQIPPENALAAGFLYTALVYWMLGLLGLPALIVARRRTATIDEPNATKGT